MLTSAPQAPLPVLREWSARLELQYVARGSETVLLRRQHEGPLRVQRPFAETSGICQTYILHPPGGIVGGDTLDVRVHVEPGARALLTTPGAAKFYRSNGELARQSQHLHVEASASIEWFPQESIVFDEARAVSHTVVHLEQQSRCALWEITCLGRPASRRPFTAGSFRQKLEMYVGGRPSLLESQHVRGDAALDATWGFQSSPFYGTLVLHPLPPELLGQVRQSVAELWSAHSEHRFAATALPFGDQQSHVVCRYLGTSAEHCKRLFTRVWTAMRPHLLGVEAEPPRVWST